MQALYIQEYIDLSSIQIQFFGKLPVFEGESIKEIGKPVGLRGTDGFRGGKRMQNFLTLVRDESLLEGNVPLKPDPIVGKCPHGGKILQGQVGIV